MTKKVDLINLKVGKVYNRVYTGQNQAYARISGKETFVVLQTEPELKVNILFDQFGNVYTDNLVNGPITFTCPEIAFKEYNIFEPENETEWFKKSIKFSSFTEAIDSGLINLKDIKQLATQSLNTSQFNTLYDYNNGIGIKASFSVEDKTNFPLLQMVYIVWNSWEELKAELEKLNLEVRI